MTATTLCAWCERPLGEWDTGRMHARCADAWLADRKAQRAPGTAPAATDAGVAELRTPKGDRNPATPAGLFEVVDLGARIAQGYKAPAYRVERFVADGTLTVLAAESGVGKSAFLQALCGGVAGGHAVGGMNCAKGDAIYVDAEMGPDMFANRACLLGATGSLPYHYARANGADLAVAGVELVLERLIRGLGANLVALDSLRALAPSCKENDNDSMAPILSRILAVARRTNAAIVVIHHRGKGDFDFRGATAIRDQCDALFSLRKTEERTLKLTCRGGGKMRYDAEPEPVYLDLDLSTGVISAVDAPACEPDRRPVGSLIEGQILDLLEEAGRAMPAAAISRRLGRSKSDGTVRDALQRLAAQERASRVADGWVAGLRAEVATTATDLPQRVVALRPLKGARNSATPEPGALVGYKNECSCSDGGLGDSDRCSRCWGWRASE